MAPRGRARRSPSLRTITTITTIALAIMAAGVSAALVLLTSSLHDAGEVLGDAVAGVWLAEEAEIDLLIHERARDVIVRRDTETGLRQKLLVAGRHVSSGAERAALDAASAEVDRYLGASRDPATTAADRARLLESSYAALEKLVGVNVAQADAAREDTARWDRLGDVIGISAGALMLTILVALLLWTRRLIVLPMLALSDAVQRSGSGASDARAGEHGAAEISAMAATLARQHRERVAYLAGIAHDLRTPLAALAMSTAVIDPERSLPTEDRVRHTLGVVRRQVTRLNRMVGDLLEAARIEAGHVSLSLQDDRDLRTVVQTVADLFEGTSPIHRLRVDLPDEPLRVRCDPTRIEQTMNNLVSNAIKYSPRGGEVQLSAQAEDERVLLSVSDEGIGIADQDLEHIWEPFRRTGTSMELIPGVGLGLSISRRIVEAHGGSISVRSTPGVGSTFTVVLPVSGPPGAVASPVAPRPEVAEPPA